MVLNLKMLIKMVLFVMKPLDNQEVDIFYVVDAIKKQEDIVNQMQKKRNSHQDICF